METAELVYEQLLLLLPVFAKKTVLFGLSLSITEAISAIVGCCRSIFFANTGIAAAAAVVNNNGHCSLLSLLLLLLLVVVACCCCLLAVSVA